MKCALSVEAKSRIAQFAHRKTLLALDFDGTLAPIVPAYSGAKMRRRTRELLVRACRVYPCAVISGRSRVDVRERLGSVSPAYVVGNHGIEPSAGTPEMVEITREAAVLLGASLIGRQGIEIEYKRFSLSVHYRRSRSDAESAIFDAVARLPFAMRTIRGKSVVNVIPVGAPDKGDALLELCSNAGADCAIFVGDDVTDEDIFAIDRPEDILSVRVGFSRESAAEYSLPSQLEVDDLLAYLCGLRASDSHT
jgi:trehalose 6-phosphate phosphatase